MSDDTAIEVVPAAPITLFGTDDPVAVVARATVIATALADVIRQKRLSKHIGQSDHVFVEGWTLLGSMLGVFAEVEWSRYMDGEAWEARAVARTLSGRVVGAAEAMCSRSEAKWKNSDDYAMRSMAQTRAVSKALRLPLGFIMELAGYSATPAEEIPEQRAERARPEPSLDQIKARLLERADEHHIDTATLDELIRERVGTGSADEVRAGLIALGTAISRGDFDSEAQILVAAESEPQRPSGALTGPVTDGLPALPENMPADKALAAGLALVGKDTT